MVRWAVDLGTVSARIEHHLLAGSRSARGGVHAVGYYNPSLPHTAELDLWLRVAIVST